MSFGNRHSSLSTGTASAMSVRAAHNPDQGG